MAPKPPKFFLMLLKPFFRPWVLEDIEGDLNELYTERLASKGKFRAGIGYLVDLLTMLNLYKTKFKISNNMKSLFIHHFKSSLRGFQKRKQYFFITVSGLVLALSAVILISLHINQEFSYDRFHANADRVVRLAFDQSLMTSAPMGPYLEEKMAQVEGFTRINYPFQALRLKQGEQVYSVSDLVFADPDFFTMFSFPLIQGANEGLLETKDQIAISENAAKRLFGDSDPIGQELMINDSLPVTVRAVFENVPANSHLQFDYALPFEFHERMGQGNRLKQWGRMSYYTYFLLSNDASLSEVEAAIDQEIKSIYASANLEPEMHLQPLTEAHFNETYSNDLASRGDLGMIRIYALAGLLVFVIACINYVNLSAALVSRRVKEIGVRKVLGAYKWNLIGQYLTEVFILTTISFGLSILVVQWAVAHFNQLLGHNLIFELFDEKVLVLFVVYLLATLVLAGIYPAILFSSLKTVDAINGQGRVGRKSFRRILVTLQFGLSLVLLILTFITKGQLQFISEFDPGYDREGVIVMPLYGRTHHEFQTMKTELLGNSLIQSVSASTSLPVNNLTTAPSGSLQWTGKVEGQEEFRININWVERDYPELFHFRLKAGQRFSDFPHSEQTRFMINQKGVEVLGLNDPMGIELEIWGQKGRIVGVLEDFNFESVRSEIEPLLLILEQHYHEFAYIKYQIGKPLEALELIEEEARQVDPNYISNLTFLDMEFQQLYEEEKRTDALLTSFSIIAVVISAMGLFAFITFIVQGRLKEISIRKVLGASNQHLVTVLSKEFLVIILIASAIAWPVAFSMGKGWLASFEYRISFDWIFFILASLVLLVITLLVISGQLIRAIRVNPTSILRKE